MASYNEDLLLLTTATVDELDNTRSEAIVNLQASGDVLLDDDLAIRQDLSLLGVASLTVEGSLRVSQNLSLLASSDISLEDIEGSSSLLLLAIASLEVSVPIEDELDVILAFGQVTLEEAVEAGLSSSGGVGAGVGPTVRVRPDGEQKVTPTTARRRTYFNG